MSISIENITIVIVSFFSDGIIDQCIQSISKKIKIIIVDNSNNKKFKDNIEKKYKNVQCILAQANLGMGEGNNLGLKLVKTDYAFILNPDVVLKKKAIDEIFKASKNIGAFGIMAPISNKNNYPNYKLDQKLDQNYNEFSSFKVKSVDGYAMLLNLKRLKKLNIFKNQNFFDENFFMYLENDDLCKRVLEKNEKIYIIPKSKIDHLGGRAVNKKYQHQIELSRNWHWIWSRFYFNKKHFGYFFALFNGLPIFLSALFKIIFYVTFNKRKKDIYLHRALGFLNAVFGRKAHFRPKIKINVQEN